MNFRLAVLLGLSSTIHATFSSLLPFEETCTAVIKVVQYEGDDPQRHVNDHLSLSCETPSGKFYNLPFADKAYIQEKFLNDGPYESGVTQIKLGPNAMVDLEKYEVLVSQGAVTEFSNPSSNILNRKRKLLSTGNKKVLIVRVEASLTTSFSRAELSDAILGTQGNSINLASQYDACSHGQLTFKAATGSGIGTGNQAGTINVSVSGDATEQKVRNAVSVYLGTNPMFLADHVLFCMPKGSIGGGSGYAYIGSWLSVYNDDQCTSVNTLMHEIGHNLGLGHSGTNSFVYGDYSCMMGSTLTNSPRKCFNAAKLWQLGWFSSRSLELDANGTNNYSGDIADMTQEPNDSSGAPIVIKMNTPSDQDYFLSFNRVTGFNSGVPEGGDEIRIQQTEDGSGTSYSVSFIRASLTAGQSWTSDANFSGKTVTVTVNSIGTMANVDICIGVCTPTKPTPTASPIAPTKSPTLPTPTDCVDFEKRIQFDNGSGSKITRSCKWAGNKSTNQRCSFDGVSEACPLTCGTCDTCIDPPSSLRFKFQKDGDSVTRSCTWVEKKQTAPRCALTDYICRATCGVC